MFLQTEVVSAYVASLLAMKTYRGSEGTVALVILRICTTWKKVDSRPGCSTSEKRAQLPTEEVIERTPETVQITCIKEILSLACDDNQTTTARSSNPEPSNYID